MEETNYRLLEYVVARYDESGAPVPPEMLVDAAQSDSQTVGERLTRLERCDLVAREGGGYRPTVTGYELLALDIDGPTLLVVDTPEDC